MRSGARPLAIHGDHPGRNASDRGNPSNEAALKLLGVENGPNIAEVTMVRCAICERAEAAQKREFLDAEKSNFRESLSPGQHGKQAQRRPLDPPDAPIRIAETIKTTPSGMAALIPTGLERDDRRWLHRRSESRD